jgi:predicted aminopeptidase
MRASAAFNRLVQQHRSRLEAVYSSNLPASEMRAAKARILSDLGSAYTNLRDTDWQGQDYFGGFFSRQVNNAQLALVASYEGGQCAFAALFREAGGDFEAFHRLAERRAKSGREAIAGWLAQDCADIAPHGKL